MPFVVMVAGPNGSGKTTLTNYLREQGVGLGRYINADDIAAELSGPYNERVRAAQSLADQQRDESLEAGIDFTFETVMSHGSKVDFFNRCAKSDYETILYFIATQDPRLNIERVKQRVVLGGHDVPADRITDRYRRSLDFLPRALQIADRAALFDNSDETGLRLCLSKSSSDVGPQIYDLEPDAPAWAAACLRATLALRAPDTSSIPDRSA